MCLPRKLLLEEMVKKKDLLGISHQMLAAERDSYTLAGTLEKQTTYVSKRYLLLEGQQRLVVYCSDL